MDRFSGRRYPAALGLLSAGIVGVGMLVKPEPHEAAPPVISESEMVRLERQAQKKVLRDLRSYFAGVAADVSRYAVRLSAGTTGIVWDDSRIVTAGPVFPRSESLEVLQSARSGTRVALVSSPPNLPVAVLGSATNLRPPPRERPEALAPGESMLFLWRAADTAYRFAPGVFIGVGEVRCGDLEFQEIQANVPLAEEMLGAGIFDVDGGLAGIVLRCGAGYAAVAAGGVDAALKLAGTPPERLLDGYGLRVEPLDDSRRAYLKVREGILVTEVWEEWAAAQAGLIPGDVIEAADGEPAVSVERFYAQAQPFPGRVLELTVRRGRKTLQIPVFTGSGYQQDSGFGLRLNKQDGYQVTEVKAGSPAEEGGIRPGDRLLHVDGRHPASATAAGRALALRSGRPTYVVMARGGRQFGVLLD